VPITVHNVGLLAAISLEIRHRNIRINKHGGTVNRCHNVVEWYRKSTSLPSVNGKWKHKGVCYKNSYRSDILLLCMAHTTCRRVTTMNNTRILTTLTVLSLVVEASDISKSNSIASSNQQEGQFAVQRFSFVFTTFRTQFFVAADYTYCKREKGCSELTLG